MDNIQQIPVVASFRDGQLEAIIYKNGGDPIMYQVVKMDIDGIKDYLSELNKPTLKI